VGAGDSGPEIGGGNQERTIGRKGGRKLPPPQHPRPAAALVSGEHGCDLGCEHRITCRDPGKVEPPHGRHELLCRPVAAGGSDVQTAIHERSEFGRNRAKPLQGHRSCASNLPRRLVHRVPQERMPTRQTLIEERPEQEDV
jgi:hypothetical protein